MKRIGEWFLFEDAVRPKVYHRDRDGFTHSVQRFNGVVNVSAFRCPSEVWARFVDAGGVWANADYSKLEFVDAFDLPAEVLAALDLSGEK